MPDPDRFNDEYDPEPDYERPTRAEAEADEAEPWYATMWERTAPEPDPEPSEEEPYWLCDGCGGAFPKRDMVLIPEPDGEAVMDAYCQTCASAPEDVEEVFDPWVTHSNAFEDAPGLREHLNEFHGIETADTDDFVLDAEHARAHGRTPS